MEVAEPAVWHMVMGATHGIGRAYAEHFAKRGAALHLVARTASELASVAGELVRLGAKECTVAAGDVLDANFREMLAALLHDPRFAAVFIGGPSPRPGSIHEASPDDFGYGIAVVFEYPEHILRIVSQRTAAIDIVFVSSAASREPLTASHRFFVSAVLRRAWDIWIPLLASGLPPHIRLHVWRPGVIVTRLSAAYVGANSLEEARGILASEFADQPVASAQEFVEAALAEDDKA